MDPTTQVIATVGGTLAIFGAFAAWLVRYMDRRFEEVKAETQRQFAEVKEDTQRLFAEAKEDTQRQFAGAKEDTQRQFAESRQLLAEAREDTRRRFQEMHEAFHRLDDKLDAQGERIADLRQEVGKLQGVVERSFQPDRFTVSAGREATAGE